MNRFEATATILNRLAQLGYEESIVNYWTSGATAAILNRLTRLGYEENIVNYWTSETLEHKKSVSIHILPDFQQLVMAPEYEITAPVNEDDEVELNVKDDDEENFDFIDAVLFSEMYLENVVRSVCKEVAALSVPIYVPGYEQIVYDDYEGDYAAQQVFTFHLVWPD